MMFKDHIRNKKGKKGSVTAKFISQNDYVLCVRIRLGSSL